MKKKILMVSTVPATLNFFRGQIQFLKKDFDIEIVSSPGTTLEIIGENEGVKTHAVEMIREISIFKDLISLFKLTSLFIRIKPDIVHGNTPKGGLLSMVSAWLARVPYRVYYIHGLRYEGAKGVKRKILMFIERISCFLSTDIISVSYGVKENLAKDKITSKTPNIIGNGSANGIDADFFSQNSVNTINLREKYDIKEDEFVFGFVGRFVGDKGVNELVNVFIELNKKHNDIKLLLIGRFEDHLDPLDDHVKKEIQTNSNIINAGYQFDVRPFLSIMDVFVFPSYREGFGVSIMEAAAMDVPVISSDISGCNEIIIDGFNGKLVKPKSTSDLLIAMEEFILQPDLLNKMKTVTRNHVIKKYSQKLVWKSALKTYQEISKLD